MSEDPFEPDHTDNEDSDDALTQEVSKMSISTPVKEPRQNRTDPEQSSTSGTVSGRNSPLSDRDRRSSPDGYEGENEEEDRNSNEALLARQIQLERDP
jgi:hypothetical protein